MSRSTPKPSTFSTPSRSGRGVRGRATSHSPGRDTGSSSGRATTLKERIDEETIQDSCGNVFEDLGFSRQEAVSLQLRSFLCFRLEEFIRERRFTQRQAAAFFGVTQPRISNLMCGRIDLFSLDTLVDMLTRAGIRVEMLLQPGIRTHRSHAGWNANPAESRPGRVSN